ncbi:MAG: hypothetical protein O7E53_00125 [Alphaproteobacteria bacterium]|nr:hypothetical protein [Alphaproteobacteria bacterium]
MAMQLHASDGLQSAIPEQLPDDTSSDRGHIMPAATLTGAVVERGRKRPGLPSGPSPVPDRPPVEPQNRPIEVVNPGPPPVEAEVVTAVDAKIQAVVAEETGDAELAAMLRTRKWFKLLRNAVIFIFVFWVGAVIAVMAF